MEEGSDRETDEVDRITKISVIRAYNTGNDEIKTIGQRKMFKND